MTPFLKGPTDYIAKHREADLQFSTNRNYVEDLERIIATANSRSHTKVRLQSCIRTGPTAA
jgi:hypothetical protein